MHSLLLYATLATTKCKHSWAYPLVIVSEHGTARKFNWFRSFTQCTQLAQVLACLFLSLPVLLSYFVAFKEL